MPLSENQADRVAEVMRKNLGSKAALQLMEDMNEAAYGRNKNRESLKSFKRIIQALKESSKGGNKAPDSNKK